MPSLTELPGLGPKSQTILAASGIHSRDDLERLGAVGAYLQVRRTGQPASLNLLWGIESALTGKPWQTVARDERTRLLLELDARSHRP